MPGSSTRPLPSLIVQCSSVKSSEKLIVLVCSTFDSVRGRRSTRIRLSGAGCLRPSLPGARSLLRVVGCPEMAHRGSSRSSVWIGKGSSAAVEAQPAGERGISADSTLRPFLSRCRTPRPIRRFPCGNPLSLVPPRETLPHAIKTLPTKRPFPVHFRSLLVKSRLPL